MKGNHLPTAKKIQILHMLCEGASMRSISRVVDCSINTVTKLMLEVGARCEAYQHANLRNLGCKFVQCDEIWSFCYAKEKNVATAKKKAKGAGDVWTWTAVCPDSKLVIAWHVSTREMSAATRFMRDLCTRFKERVQITSDGHSSYLKAVEAAFGSDVHFAMLVKDYSEETGLNLQKRAALGNPDMTKVSTSAVERQNLSMRMGMRRYTRKTNGHSKKLDNHKLALALYFFYQNFVRINSGLRVTPAMAAGVSDKVWSWEDVLAM